MKSKILILIFLISVLPFIQKIRAQDLLGFDNITLENNSDYIKAEPKALEAAGQYLNTPFDSRDESRTKAIKFVLMWMDGTKDFTFYVDSIVRPVTNSNNKLLSLYMACMAKYVLEHKNMKDDRKEITYQSVLMYLDYCTNPDNHVKQYRELRKLVKARDEGELREYLK